MKPKRVVPPTTEGDPPRTVKWRNQRFIFSTMNKRKEDAALNVERAKAGTTREGEPRRRILVKFDPPATFATGGEARWGVYEKASTSHLF